MKVRFLKNHLDWKLGDQVDFNEDMARYLISCGTAEPIDINPKQTVAILLNHLETHNPKKSKKK